jgi:hypothetical protein
MKYFQEFSNEEYEKLSSNNKFVQFDNLSNNVSGNDDNLNKTSEKNIGMTGEIPLCTSNSKDSSYSNTNVITNPEQPMKKLIQ